MALRFIPKVGSLLCTSSAPFTLPEIRVRICHFVPLIQAKYGRVIKEEGLVLVFCLIHQE